MSLKIGWEGNRVAAIAGPYMRGGFAEFCLAGADCVIKAPDDVPLMLGAAFPVVALTSYHLLYSAHRIRKGETILIHAIGGGVGLMLTQLARSAGARIMGTVGFAGKGARALAYGAGRIVVRDHEDFATAALDFTDGKGIDLVIVSLGGQVLERSFDALRTYGRVINIGEAASYPLEAARDAQARLEARGVSGRLLLEVKREIP